MRIASLAVLACSSAACVTSPGPAREPLGKMPEVVTTAEPEWIPWSIRAGKPVAADPRERRLAELRQLTFGGENAGARFSPDATMLIFQAVARGARCPQIFVMDLGTGETRPVPTGGGPAAHPAFFPAGDRILYSTAPAAGEGCPPRPGPSADTWPPGELDVISAKVDGSDARPIFAGPGLDAEAAAAPVGARLVFTSTRDGDPELYTASLDGSNVRRATSAPGPDGGASFSPDGTKLVWHASRASGPGKPQVWLGGAEGQSARPITRGDVTSFAPSFLPDSRRVIFASDADAATPAAAHPSSSDLYVIDPEGPLTAAGGAPVERVTFAGGLHGSPVFSPDGRYLVFSSSRSAGQRGDTDLFVARWVE